MPATTSRKCRERDACSPFRCCAKSIPIGVLVLQRSQVRAFTDKQIELATTFADQAVIAIENVRLFDEIQDKSRQLQLASEHKSQFLASMSHELRTPLNAIIGLTEMMVANAARFGTEKAAEPLNRVHRAGTHLLSLINQVLDLSKIEAGKLELNPQTVELAPLIDEVAGTARQLAEQNKNRLVVECEPELAPITADPMRLRQILLNLLSNACKFTKDGEVALKARKDGHDFVELAVSDTGIGMTAGPAGQAVRGIQPGRGHHRPALRRHRAGACHLPQARAHDGRRCDGGERARPRLGFHAASARARRAGRALVAGVGFTRFRTADRLKLGQARVSVRITSNPAGEDVDPGTRPGMTVDRLEFTPLLSSFLRAAWRSGETSMTVNLRAVPRSLVSP